MSSENNKNYKTPLQNTSQSVNQRRTFGNEATSTNQRSSYYNYPISARRGNHNYQNRYYQQNFRNNDNYNYNNKNSNNYFKSKNINCRNNNLLFKKAKDRKSHAGISMKGFISDCVICCQKSDIFGVGSCQHSMCMECAIRMRILDKSKLCPQCRTEIKTLYFVTNSLSGVLNIPKETISFDDTENYNVCFENNYVLDCFKSYMAHGCKICNNRNNLENSVKFSDFSMLQQHMSQAHNLSFCYLCTSNINVLTKDRKVYNRYELQRHMNGDNTDEAGFTGHPKCFYCEERFFDEEQQFKHLRLNHFFCQICNNDEPKNFFYKTHKELINHYKKKHHPCLHADCLPAGIVFRSSVELNIHNAKQHCQGRKLMQLDFQIAGGNSSVRFSNNSSETSKPPSTSQSQVTIVPSAQSSNVPVRIVPSATCSSTQFSANFPALNLQKKSSNNTQLNWKQSNQYEYPKKTQNMPLIPIQSGEQFPGLPSKKIVYNQSKNSNTVWSKCNTKELFKPSDLYNLNQKKNIINNNMPGPSSEKRKKFIPDPDCFPEGMREILKARQAGLPDPVVKPIEPSQTLLFEEMKKKQKKKKDKNFKNG